MTTDPDRLRAMAGARDALTPAARAAKAASMQAKLDSRLTSWATFEDQIDVLNNDIDTLTTAKATATTNEATAAALATSNASTITDLNKDIQDLLDAIALGGDATAEDLAERAEYRALLSELSLTLP